MIIGVGTDLLSIDRMRRVLAEDEEPFLRSCFDEEERRLAQQRPDPLLFYATRFAAKEAVFKSLGLSAEGVRLHEIGIGSDENGQPQVRLAGSLAERAAGRGIARVHVSISWDTGYAMAHAVAETA